MASKKKIVVTGFEPFAEHTVNSSWVAVQHWVCSQELERLGLGEAVDLYVCEMPVEYQAVKRLLPSLWKENQPQLVVHVGVSGLATTVTLERCGHNKGYTRPDNCSFCPASQCCVENGPDCIKSILDMDTICKRVNDAGIGITVSTSEDAGRYLCDYTYYTSLHLGKGRAAFVHVPPLAKPYSGKDLGRALQAVIQEMLKLLEGSHSEEAQKGTKHSSDNP
ncbi:pyroglutamyl-peptidase 1-like isoform X1 [Haplochromis burtoni]|uniref:pyroglutamyl-peptidase 1 isoform X1 n=1 Tax=Haplochromis burtoni TaxID=8153 RepID=UPI001C2D595E|nr:pyroglutamyl-peptidase 1 isoform X1 [Haplochromis burtoni]XP_042075920.1 pyroglutamyl-peptidase 1-like isoform X1 [Haplochromis burtoni]